MLFLIHLALICINKISDIFVSIYGYDSSLTIETISADDIEQIDAAVRSFLVSNKDKGMSKAEKSALYGEFEEIPEVFSISMGEKVLLKKIVDHTKQKRAEHGGSYFQELCETQGENDNCTKSESESVIVCSVNKKLIFVHANIASPKNSPNKNAKKNVNIQKKKFPRDIESTALNQGSSTTLSQASILSGNLRDDEYMRSKLIDKIREKFSKKSPESTEFDEQHVNQILEKLHELSLRIIRNEMNIVGVCSCFCGSQIKLTFENNKKNDSGHWKLWNLERHLKSHIVKSRQVAVPINGKCAKKNI